MFLFAYRKTLYAIRSLPLCPYTSWVYNNEDCNCNFRLGFVRLLIDDFVNFMNYEEFNPLQALYNFERVYRNIPFARLLMFPNVNEEELP